MRICLMSPEYPPDTGLSETGSYIHQLASGLKECRQEFRSFRYPANKKNPLSRMGLPYTG